MVMHPRVTSRGWGGIRKVASGGTGRNLTDQAREILGGSLDPDRFLFTHCTIVASVDVDVAPDVKLGTVKVGSSTVNRKYADYLIKPGCSQFVNNNGDSWSRDVLMKSYRTFVGSHNFLEHVQIEEQSKGRIIDAVARDIGDSVYVDILVATDRKHASLVAEIESGKMGTLSMGCTTDFTLCSEVRTLCRRRNRALRPHQVRQAQHVHGRPRTRSASSPNCAGTRTTTRRVVFASSRLPGLPFPRSAAP